MNSLHNMTVILCKFCKQTNSTVNHDLCREFYLYIMRDKIKKITLMLALLHEELKNLE